MKNKFVLITVLILSSFNLYAQWQPDVRMTDDIAFSSTSFNNARCIATSGNSVHVAWFDKIDLNEEIYYKHSEDGGVNWSAIMRLSINSSASRYPSIAVSGLNVHVVWYEGRDGNWEIYYKRSVDGGLNWGAETRLTNDPSYSGNPSLAVSGQDVHLVWEDNRDGGNDEIYYKHSTDGGLSWGADTRLTNNSGESATPSIWVSGQFISLVWNEDRDGNWEIYYKRSINGGVNWETDTRLTNNTAVSGYPTLSVSGSIVNVVWHDNRESNFEIFYKRSTDMGLNWQQDVRLTDNNFISGYPSIAATGSSVHVVWEDDRDGNYEIYYKVSPDGGSNWNADTRLTNSNGISDRNSISVSGSIVHVVWEDNRDGNYELYYKRNPTGNITGIENISLEIPCEFKLEQNYPNPFNPSTKIKFTIPNVTLSLSSRAETRDEGSRVQLKVYDVLGNEVATLVDENKSAGTYEIDFSVGRDSSPAIASGIYFYQLKAGEYISTKKMTLIK